MKRNTIVKICQWGFTAAASLMATMSAIVGDYLLMIWVLLALATFIANSYFEKLIDERDECIFEQAKKIGELTELCNSLVENNNELVKINEALLNEMDNQSLSDSKQ